MSEETASIPADALSAAIVRVPDGRLHAALESVINVSGEVADSVGAAQSMVDALVRDLELARARLYLLTSEGDGDGHTHLELAAAAGPHAAFTREMPSVALDGSTDIARVGESGEPEFHGDMHGLGHEPEGGHQGLGRWRSAVTTQSSAVLPLALRGRHLGVLSVEWSTPREFDEPERDDLMSTAAAAALVIDSFLAEERLVEAAAEPASDVVAPPAAEASEAEQAQGEAPLAAVEEIAAQPESIPVRLGTPPVEAPASAPALAPAASPEATVTNAELEVTRDGHVYPVAIGGTWASAPALGVHVGIASPQGDTEDVFWECTGLADGFVVLALGMVTAPNGDAHRIAETSRHMLRASASHDEDPARGLDLVAGWLGASGSNSAWLSAVVANIDVHHAMMTWCAVGSAALVSRYADGRFGVAPSQYAPLGSSAPSNLASRNALLLPGDRVALACGEVGALSSGLDRARAMASLTVGAKANVLLRALRAPSGASGAIAIEVQP